MMLRFMPRPMMDYPTLERMLHFPEEDRLREIAVLEELPLERQEEALRMLKHLARWGGHEIACVLADAVRSEQPAEQIAANIQSKVQKYQDMRRDIIQQLLQE